MMIKKGEGRKWLENIKNPHGKTQKRSREKEKDEQRASRIDARV